MNEAGINRLGIRWGPMHIDRVINKRGEPRIIDVGPRLTGRALMARLDRFSESVQTLIE